MGPKKGAAKPAAKASKPAAKAAAKAPAPAAPAGKGVSVYIKNLAFPGMNNDTVAAVFKSCGAVKGVKLRRKKYCIVHFGSPDHAAKAKELNGKVVKGNKVSVEAAKKGPTPDRSETCTSVFVGGLSKIPRKDARAGLKKEFDKCGAVVKVRTYQTNKGMHGFVYFKDNAAAKKAVTTMDSTELSKPFTKLASTSGITVRYSVRTKALDQKKEKVRKARIAAAKA
eukprot:Hpha_TRINITY_DN15227_c1_g14::TRINITY_DN15227_c1_g14_i1::g.65280::m.65280